MAIWQKFTLNLIQAILSVTEREIFELIETNRKRNIISASKKLCLFKLIEVARGLADGPGPCERFDDFALLY